MSTKVSKGKACMDLIRLKKGIRIWQKKKKRKQQERTIERTANELEITWPQLEIINEEIEKLKALEEEFGEEEY